MKREPTKMLFVRIPESWYKQLEAIAESEAQTMSALAKQAIKAYLDRRIDIFKAVK